GAAGFGPFIAGPSRAFVHLFVRCQPVQNKTNVVQFGGRGGIRTHGALAGTPVFKTGALNHSATLPSAQRQSLSRAKIKDGLAGFWATGAPSSSQFNQPDQRAQGMSGESGLPKAVSSTPR